MFKTFCHGDVSYSDFLMTVRMILSATNWQLTSLFQTSCCSRRVIFVVFFTLHHSLYSRLLGPDFWGHKAIVFTSKHSRSGEPALQ